MFSLFKINTIGNLNYFDNLADRKIFYAEMLL